MNQIVSAIESGFTDKALSLIKNEFLSISDGLKLLNIAFKFDAVDVFKFLINESHLRFDMPTHNYESKLRAASYQGLVKFVKMIMEEKLISNDCVLSSLNAAILNGHAEIVKILLHDERICQYDLSVHMLTSAFERNSNSTSSEIIKIILSDKRCDPSLYNNNALMHASDLGLTKIVKMLLSDKRTDPSSRCSIGIILASEKNYVDIVKILLADERVDPTTNQNEPIRDACYYNRIESAKILLDIERVDPTAKNNEAVRMACEEGDLEILELLLHDKRIKPFAIDVDRLNIQNRHNIKKVIEMLKTAGWNINDVSN